MSKILVTGADGQLGKCLRDASKDFDNYDFVFVNRGQLDVTNKASIDALFATETFQYCINAAAYTNVEKAESEEESAYLVNAEGAKNIAEACEEREITLIHISTDYVFDGTKRSPYVETDETHAISVYGASKLKGEEWIQEKCTRHFIMRTSWLYSQYGHNFFNSMLRFADEGRDLSITTEQLGTPTNANDLAYAALSIIASGSEAYGIYHFSNEGAATWFDFAKAIFEHTGKLEAVSLEKTDHYRTFAARPAYSVLSKEKFYNHFNTPRLDWQESLKILIDNQKSV
ncbi:dTDP-4-dehydrorhamnose reductase [Aureisphaera galaxeae]|uniref:dTDP-4-dehydrorhamnose reductase n=1 Tax=Aureisphaera galaxeae TaxID=1538023 RepID=UPI00234FC72A|nr:dTDP-4-dehydrorhamnose reductase [Aureisphaera galaxeae]MDC8005078.1 dTDP-4-dehydrorhamnose reductase [Aureisphaera galaxeae]